MSLGQTVRAQCPVSSSSGVRCELREHHNSPHESTAHGGTLTWEPSYVAELRREAERGPWRWRNLLQDVLDDLGDGITSEAIEDAREAILKEGL